MVHLFQVDKPSAHGFADGLFAQADTQDGLLAGIVADNVQQQSGFFRNARPRRQQDLVIGFEIGQPEAVIAQYADGCPQFLYQVAEVVGKGVVIINDDDVHGFQQF